MEGGEQHTQTCSQRRDRKRKNPTPEKIEAMSEKVLTFVTEEPPEDIVTYPLVPSQAPDVNGGQDDRLADNSNSLMAVDSTNTSVDSDGSELPKKQSILVPSQALDVNGGQDDRLADNGNSLMAVDSTNTSVDSDGSELPKKQSINYVPTGRPRGRPRLNKSDVPKAAKNPLGRPRIHAPVTPEQKRPPGRPRIHPVKDPSMKKPRGRPRKHPAAFDASQAQENKIKHLMVLLAEKDAEICLLRRRLHDLGEDVPATDAQKLDNNDATANKRCFVYVNPDGSIQDVNPPAVPCNGRVVDSTKHITMHDSLTALATEHISLNNGISVWQNH